MNIQMRHLGKTDILISPIGLGVMEFAGGGGILGWVFPVIPQEEKNAIIKAALDGGINWFDTAEAYGSGVSERSLATALQAAGKSDEEVIVATKWLPFFRTAGNIPHSINDRLKYLDGYSISNYMVHQPTSFFFTGGGDECHGRSGGSRQNSFGGCEQLQPGPYASSARCACKKGLAIGGKPGQIQFAEPCDRDERCDGDCQGIRRDDHRIHPH
jgi:Aldo/keto reductase family